MAARGHATVDARVIEQKASVLTTGPIQEAGLDSRIAPYRGVSRILGRRRRLEVVLAIQPESLNDINGVLLVGHQVRVRGLEERSRHMAGVFAVSTDQTP